VETEETICRRIFLIRHGHYERTGGLGDTVWGLSAHGRRQAVRVGRRLSRLADSASGRFEGAYASPWPRASETAEIAAREMDLASVKVKTYLHEVTPIVDPAREEFRLFPMGTIEPTSTQERATAQAQIDRVRARYFKPPRRAAYVLLFTHGNLIRYLVTSTLGLPCESWARMDIAHTSITEIRVYANGFHALICFNDTGHLPPSMITTS
jgi:broad specificity phosphatase PhoE